MVGTIRIAPEAAPRADRVARAALLGGALVVALVLVLGLSASPRSSSHRSHAAYAHLPLPAKALVSRTLARDDRSFAATPVAGGLGVRNAHHHLSARFSHGGVLVRSGSARFGLSLHAYGYAGRLRPLAPATPRADHNRVSYERPGLSEWYANGPLGLEQGFTLKAPPVSHRSGPLVLALGLSGNVRASVERGRAGLTLAPKTGGPSLRYTGLSATDARGQSLRTWLELRGRTVLLRVNDAGAQYPLKIDPFVQEAKLTASDGGAVDALGGSVAISGDTVVAGAIAAKVDENSQQGAAYVFVKPPTGWANATQTAKLTASDGAAFDGLGKSVAISGDTVVAGSQEGAYVFVKPPTGWANATQTAKLTASGGTLGDVPNASVAVSGDTVVAAAPNATVGSNAVQGAAYVYVKPATGWANATQTAKLTASDGGAFDQLGQSVAVSGNTVVAGADQEGFGFGSTPDKGAAYVFVKPATGWANATQTAKLTASDGATGDILGRSVAVSGDTVVAGAPAAKVGANTSQGAAYLFLKPGTGWADATQTAKLTASDGAAFDSLGFPVDVSGNTVVVGAGDATVGTNALQGAAYVFLKPETGWANETEMAKLTATDGAAGDRFGTGVGVSGDTVVAGAPGAKIGANSLQGAAYVFGPGADLAITKTVSPNPPLQGHKFKYTITVTNNGPEDATHVTVTDPLPDIRFVSADSSQGKCTRSTVKAHDPNDGTVRCSLGSLANGASATVTIVMSATGKPGRLTNTATVTADQKDPNQANNSASALINIEP